MREPFYSDMNAAVEDMYSIICKNLTCSDEYMLFGYSMGSMIASAVLQQILVRGQLRLPKHIFLAAHVPNISGRSVSKEELENDETVKKHIIQFGGVPEDVAGSAIFWKIYLPIYRADYNLMQSFDFDRLELQTTLPASVFYCEEDTSFADIKRWKQYYKGSVSYISFIGGHFFIKENAEKIGSLIGDRGIN